MKVKQIFTLLTLSLAIISSCSTKDNFNIDLNTKYTIAEKKLLKIRLFSVSLFLTMQTASSQLQSKVSNGDLMVFLYYSILIAL